MSPRIGESRSLILPHVQPRTSAAAHPDSPCLNFVHFHNKTRSPPGCMCVAILCCSVLLLFVLIIIIRLGNAVVCVTLKQLAYIHGLVSTFELLHHTRFGSLPLFLPPLESRLSRRNNLTCPYNHEQNFANRLLDSNVHANKYFLASVS